MSVFGSIMKGAGAARDWTGAALERRKERKQAKAEARDAAALAAASSVYVIPRSYVDGLRAVGLVATVSVFFFLFLWCLDEAKDSVVVALLTRWGFWSGRAEFSIPLMIGFFIISLGIALFCKNWVVPFTQMKWRGNGEGYAKSINLVLGVLTSAIVIMGTFTLTQGGRIEAHRPEVEAVAQHAAAVAAAQTRLASIERDLREAMGPEDSDRPSTQQQACRNTRETWQVRIDRTPASDWQRPAIVRAISDAIRCDQLRADRAEAEQAVSALEAQVVGRAVADRDMTTASVVDSARNVRGVLVALTVDLLAIFSSFLAVAVDRVRQRQLHARAQAVSVSLKPDDEGIDTGIDTGADDGPQNTNAPELNLPPLPNLRDVEDPEFDERGMPVDESGRRLRRVAGSFRAEKPAPRSADRRRADEPDPAPAASGDDGEPVSDDDLDNIAAQARAAAMAGGE